MSMPDWWTKGTRGDVAAGALGYAAGFAVDLMLFPAGVPPGTTAAVFAVAAVGAKNTVQSAWHAGKARGTDTEAALDGRASRFEAVLRNEAQSKTANSTEADRIAKVLSKDRDLWNKNVLTTTQFEQALESHIQEFRALPPE